MIEHFGFDGHIYSYVFFKDLEYEDLPPKKTYKKSKYLDLGCGFDIETTRIPQDIKYSTMWLCAFSINDLTVIFRHWWEVREFLDMIAEYYELSNDCRLLCYIHNESFEFSFLKGQLEWNYDNKHKCYEIFGTDDRQIIKACTSNFIEFRDSAVLTQMSLDKLAKTYELDIHKLTGGLNYHLTRTSQTPVKLCELAYMINDVQILSKFYFAYVRKEFIEKGHKIPLTSTGVVRDELKRNFKNMPKAKRRAIEKQIRNSFPDEEMYNIQIHYLFRGGYVHCNTIFADELLYNNDIMAMDIKSSYPASALQNKFPSYFKEFKPEWFYNYGENKRLLKEWGYYGLFEFNNIRAKYHHTIESKDKLVEFDEASAIFDNGRLLKCDKIKVWLTEQDYFNYLDFYDFDKPICHKLYVSKKELLPSYLRENFLKYFYLKETIDKELYPVDYSNSKSRLNANFGMCCSGLMHTSHTFNPEKNIMELGGRQKSYGEVIQGQILLPIWGIYVSAFSRRRLLSMVAKMPQDVYYCDTDSIYLQHFQANKRFFDWYNQRIEKVNLTMNVNSYENIIYKDLGKFSIDSGRIVKFKTLGAKRYIYQSISEGHLKTKVTIAGCKKGSLEKYSKETKQDIFEIFSNNMELDTKYSQKLTTAYKDEPFSFMVTDYMGNTSIINEKSSVSLYEIPFNLKMMPKYIELICQLKEYNNKTYGRRM